MNIFELADPHSLWPYIIHVIAGIVILYSAVIALASKKGSKRHVAYGQVFVILSIFAGVTALIFMVDFGFVPNIFGTSVLAISVVTSSFLALKPYSKSVKLAEFVSLLLTFAVAIILISRFIEFASSDGLISEAAFFTFGCAVFPSFFLAYDLYFVSRKSAERRRLRINRHACGMAFMVAVMVHAPIVSVFTEINVNFYIKFFGPYALWPLIYYYYVHWLKPNKSSKSDGVNAAVS